MFKRHLDNGLTCSNFWQALDWSGIWMRCSLGISVLYGDSRRITLGGQSELGFTGMQCSFTCLCVADTPLQCAPTALWAQWQCSVPIPMCPSCTGVFSGGSQGRRHPEPWHWHGCLGQGAHCLALVLPPLLAIPIAPGTRPL